MSTKIILRNYQENIVKKVIESDRKDMVQLPTGSGKTVIAAFLVKRYLKQNKKILFLAHREELLKQAKELFSDKFNISSGIIKAQQQTNLAQNVQIASIQTYHRRLNFNPDVIIVDEAHHSEAKTYQKIITEHSDAKLIGLTATPCLLSSKGFNETFDNLITTKTVKELESEKYLVPARCFSYPIAHDKLSRIKITGGDYNEKQLELIMNDIVLIEDILINYQKNAFGKKMIVFAASVNHSKNICEKFMRNGIKALHVDAKTENRKEILNEFRYGDTNILCNVGIATEGVDIPEIEVVCMARPTMSLSLYLQMCGRGARTKDNKSHYILFDHANNFFEHGAPNKEHNWNLYFSGLNKTDKEQLQSKKFKLVFDDGREIEVENILDIPADVKGFELVSVGVDVKEIVSKERTCGVCNVLFKPHHKNSKYCSAKCYGIKLSKFDKSERACKVCSALFKPRHKDSKCCSNKCSNIAQLTFDKSERACKICSASFKPHHKTSKYCSNKCYSIGRRIIDSRERACEICSASFKPHNKDSKYCSKKCGGIGRTNEYKINAQKTLN